MKTIFSLLLILLIISCTKDMDKPIMDEEHPEFYIKANINGDSILYVKEYYNQYMNGGYTIYGGIHSSNLRISRLEKTDGLGGNYIAIYISRIQLDSIHTPYIIPKIPFYPNPYIEIQYGKYANYNSNTTDDSLKYTGATLAGSNIYLSILNKENDIIFGRFSGELKTNTGQIVIIENGEFRSKIIRDEK